MLYVRKPLTQKKIAVLDTRHKADNEDGEVFCLERTSVLGRNLDIFERRGEEDIGFRDVEWRRIEGILWKCRKYWMSSRTARQIGWDTLVYIANKR